MLPQGYWMLDPPEEIPADGVLPLQFGCDEGCDDFGVTVVVMDSSGAEVAGLLIAPESGEQWRAWKPEAPLAEGEQYTLSLGGLGEQEQSEWTFGAGPANPDVVPAAALSVGASVETYLEGTQHCCFNDEPGSCEAEYCFTNMESAEVAMRVVANWFQSEDKQWLQFAYQARFFAASGEHTTTWQLGYSLDHEFAPQAAVSGQYCVELRARHLTTGVETEVAQHCVASTDVDVPDPDAVNIDRRTTVIDSCDSPPPEFEQLWCETHREEILDDVYCDTPRCRAAEGVCDFSGGANAPGGEEGDPEPPASDDGSPSNTDAGVSLSDDSSSGDEDDTPNVSADADGGKQTLDDEPAQKADDGSPSMIDAGAQAAKSDPPNSKNADDSAIDGGSAGKQAHDDSGTVRQSNADSESGSNSGGCTLTGPTRPSRAWGWLVVGLATLVHRRR